jgi:oligosaccharide repeat unit polymerase
MFKPFNLLIVIVFLYLFFPTLGFGIFPEYFDLSISYENFVVLGVYIIFMLLSALTAMKIENIGHYCERDVLKNRMLENWQSRGSEQRAKLFLGIFAGICLSGLLLVMSLSGMLNSDYSPHELRMKIASGGNILSTIVYNLTSLLILISANLIIISLKKSNKKFFFRCLLIVNFALIVATGQRSMIMLAICSYLLLDGYFAKGRISFKVFFILGVGLAFVIFLGMARQGDEYSFESMIWQISVRFDLFYLQFFNFLEVYRNLDNIDYGYFHLTYPLQIIPSSIFQSKPETFLHFINRDLMNIPEGTGNDFTSFAEFIYNYGVVLGLFFYSIFVFFASFVIHRIYRRARTNPIYFAIYIPSFLVYLSLVLLTGISNQAHIFAVASLFIAVIPCVLFVSYTGFNR